MAKRGPCPECKSTAIYRHADVTSGAAGAVPRLLPDLGGFGYYASMAAYLCADCGYLRFYASKEARDNVRKSVEWRAMTVASEDPTDV